jgi:hypothetical protein
MISTAPQKPSTPVAKPNLRNKMAPRMVDRAVKYTGAVPKPLLFIFFVRFTIFNLNSIFVKIAYICYANGSIQNKFLLTKFRSFYLICIRKIV